MTDMNRRDLIRFMPVLLALGCAPKLLWPRIAQAAEIPAYAGRDRAVVHGSNFRAIYGNPILRDRFLGFLHNVYSIYPDKQFHALILSATQNHETDEDIYREIQRRLPEVTPFMALLRYSLPSLEAQKTEMVRQATTLLNDSGKVVNYVEIGTPGRYVNGIEKHIHVSGTTYLLNTARPSYTAGDIAERGQIMRVGKFVDLDNYDPVDPVQIKPGQIGLVSNFIGFHHAPPERRDAFIKSVADLLPPGGRLLLRDHDVDSDDMAHIVALAHDVFNAGLQVPWETNEAEIRNFTSVEQIEGGVKKYGLERHGQLALQNGDPTRNTLMAFIKT